MASFKRSIGLIAAAAVAMAAGSAEAAKVVSAVLTQAPTVAGTTAKVLVKYTGDAVNISGIQFGVLYNSSEVELTGVVAMGTDAANKSVQFNQNPPEQTPTLNPAEEYEPDPPFTAMKPVSAYEAPNPWTAGDLLELTFTAAPTYPGSFTFDILPFGASSILTDNSEDPQAIALDGDGGVVIPADVIYSSPVITSVTPDGSWVANENLTVTINGSGFYNGTSGAPVSEIVFDGVAYTPTTFSSTQLTLDVPVGVVTEEDKVVYVANTVTQPTDSNADNVDIVDRDIVYVDDTYAAGDYSEGDFVVAGTPNRYFDANAFADFSDSVAAVNAAGTVNVASGTYTDVVTLGKAGVKVIGAGGPVLQAPTDASNAAIVTVTASGVEIDSMYFNVNRPDATVGIAIKNGVGSSAANLKVANCRFAESGSGGAANPTHISFGTGSIGISIQGTSSVAPVLDIKNNLIGFDLADGVTPAPFDRALFTRVATGLVSGNSICGVNHDAIIQFVHGAPMTISGNTFLGWGNDGYKGAQLDLTESEDDVLVSGNTFTPQADVVGDPDAVPPVLAKTHVRSLMIKNHNKSTVDIEISGNTFNLRKVGVLAANSLGQTIHNNTFQPQVGAAGFVGVEISNKVPTGGNVYPRTNSAIITLNTFKAGDGTGIAFLNHNSVQDPNAPLANGLFNNLIVGGAGVENTFEAGLTTYVNLDGQSGPSKTGSPATSPIAGYAGVGLTTMAPFPVDLIAGENNFGGVIGSAATVVQGFDITDQIADGLDTKAPNSRPVETGVVRFDGTNLYVSQATGSVKRGVAKAIAADTVNVEGGDAYVEDSIEITKALTIDGHTTRLENVDEEVVSTDVDAAGVPALAPSKFVAVNGLPLANQVTGFIIKSSDVTIRDINIEGQDANNRISSAIRRELTTLYDRTVLDNVYIKHVGHFSNGKKPGVFLGQPVNAGIQSAGNVVQNSSFVDCGYAGLWLMSGDTAVTNNIFNGMGYQGLFVTNNNGGSAAPSPKVVATLNTFTAAEVGVKVQTVTDDSLVSNNTFEIGSYVGFLTSGDPKPNIGMQVEWGPCAVSNNTFEMVGPVVAPHIGLWIWDRDGDPDNASTVSGNTFANLVSGKVGTAIELVGLRIGNLSGSSSNDGWDTKAVITGNTITNYVRGIVLDHADTDSTLVSADIKDDNNIIGCNTGILIDGQYASASITNNSASIHGGLVGVDIAAGTATVTGNSIYDNGIGVQVRDAGTATVSGNTLYNNPKQFAFSTDSTVNGFASSALLSADLETIALANTVNGKTYIAAGMGETAPSLVAEANFINLRNTIQGSINAALAGNTVKAMAGEYLAQANVDKTLRLRGAGYASTTIKGPKNAAAPNTVNLGASNSILEGFTITRDGNNAADWLSNTQNQGVSVGQVLSGITIQDNRIEGCRNALYMNNTQNHMVRRNVITNNRTGIQVANDVSGVQILENEITNNWTMGLLFNFGTGTNGFTARSNNISGNWFAQVECRWGNASAVDLSGNWFGSNVVTVANTQSQEAGYAPGPGQTVEQVMPVVYGGSVSNPNAPNGARIISGQTSSLVDYNAWLNAGTDNIAAMGFQGDFSTLNIAAASPLAKKAGGVVQDSHVNDAVLLIADGAATGMGRKINVTPGTYADGVAAITKPVLVTGNVANRAAAVFNPLAEGQDGFSIESHDVKIEGLTISGVATGNKYARGVVRGATTLYNNTNLYQLAISDITGRGIELSQPAGPVASNHNVVYECTFDKCGYAGVLNLSGDLYMFGCTFNNMGYQGILAKPAGAGHPKPGMGIYTNFFYNTPAAVRLIGAADDSKVGDFGYGNEFHLGTSYGNGITMANKSTLGVSIESTKATVRLNRFYDNNGYTAGYGGNIGVFGWDNEAGLTITENEFVGQGSPQSRAIYLTGFREGDLSNTSGGRNHGKTNATVRLNDIENFGTAVLIENADDATKAVEVGFLITNIINGVYTTGINFDGAFAKATGDAVTGVTFSTAPVAGGKYVVNTSTSNIDISTNSFAGFTPASAPMDTTPNLAKFFNLANLLTDKLNGSAYGYLNLKNGNVFVPNAKEATPDASLPAVVGVISRGALAAEPGEDVLVQAGTYGNTTIMNAVNVFSANGDHQAIVTGTGALGAVNMTLPAGSGTALLDGFKITGTAAYGTLVTAAVSGNNSSFGIQNCLYDGLADNSYAIGAGGVNLGGGAGSIKDNVIRNSGVGVAIQAAKNITVDNVQVLDNFGTGIAAVGGAEGIVVKNSKVINSGMRNTLVGTALTSSVANAEAYGVFFSSGTGNKLENSTIAHSAATGVWVKDQSVVAGTTLVKGNRIEHNGLSGIIGTGTQNTDGIKIKSSSNVTLDGNYIENNVRAAVLVDAAEADAATIGSGIALTKNRISGTVPQMISGTPFEAGLLLQMYNGSTSLIDAKGNWWGHVYGPQHSGNVNYAAYTAGDRGDLYRPQSGSADVSTWYGQRSYVNRWYALNDQDGDGIVDADEDLNLNGVQDAGETKFLRTDVLSKDSDNDGFGDGVEIALSSDPSNVAETPVTVDPANANPLTALANSSADADNDGFKDYYEIAVGTSPSAAVHPNLGNVNHVGDSDGTAVLDIIDIGFLRRALVATTALTDAAVNQDNMDISRDGAVSNIDAIVLRRKIAGGTAYKLPLADK